MPSPTSEHAEGAFRYIRGVLNGTIPAGELVKLACQRMARDLTEAEAGRGEWEFRADIAERAMRFVSILPNIKGPQAGKPLVLLDWQRFVIANLMGWVARGTATRRFRQGSVWVPRGNGKTTLAAPLALLLTFADGEGGAEGYAAAVTRDQARIMWDTAAEMVRRSPDFRAHYGVSAGARSIYSTRTASKLVSVSSDAKALDGLNVQVAVLDEIGSHKTPAVYEIMLTALGKRTHPLLLGISTATGNQTGIGRQLWQHGERVLRQQLIDDRFFFVAWAADRDDDPWADETLVKANPSWGTAVQPDAIRSIRAQARSNPAQETAFKTRHLNLWVGADNALFSARAWDECVADLSLDDLTGTPCHIGLDLASRTDLAALSIVFPAGSSYKVFSRAYLNQGAIDDARSALYPQWAADSALTVTSGDETDFGVIEQDILDLCRTHNVQSVAVDPWQAAHLGQRLAAEGVNVIEFRATTQNFSEPTKELDAAMRSGRLQHDGNPVLSWCIGNVVGQYDARGNVYPRKERPEQKIDLAIATIMAIARCLVADDTSGSYLDSSMPVWI